MKVRLRRLAKLQKSIKVHSVLRESMLRAVFAILAISTFIPSPCFAAKVKIQAGETLSEIAQKYKISVDTLMRINNINNPNKIEVGQELSIPNSSGTEYSLDQEVHTVIQGDTLSKIALMYKVSEKKLVKLNNINSSDYLYIGQRITVNSKKDFQAKETYLNYVVKSGDSLSQIALKYGLSQQDLISLNNLRGADYLYLGQTIRIPVSQSKEISYNEIKPEYHIVRQGQSLSSISKLYNLSTQKLIEINNLSSPNKLQVGQKLSLVQTRKTAFPIKKIALNEEGEANEVALSLWRNYGPLQIDWSGWKSMNGSYVAPTLHKNGNALYVAINCPLKKLNSTRGNGSWRSWISPEEKFEHQLVDDRCKENSL